MTTPSSTASAPEERVWTRDLVLASVANLVLAFVFYSLMTTTALYAVERFGASDTAAGLASSVFVIGAVVARLFAGNLSDLVGRRRILLVSMVVFVVASFSYLPVDASADALGVLLAVRAVHGAAFGVASTAAMSLAQSLIPMSRRAEGTGYFTLSTTLATAVGPFLGLLLVHGPGYDALFLVNGSAAVLGIVFAALLLRTRDVLPDAQERARLRRFHVRDMLHPDVVPVASFMLVLAIAFSSVLTFLNSYAVEKGLEDGASLYFLVYAIVLFASRLVAGRVQDRRGDNVVVYVALAAFALGLALMGLATSDVVLVVAGGFTGLGFGTLMSSLQSVAVGRVPMRRVGVAISTHFFMVDLGVGVGPVLLGLLLHVTGYGPMYLVLAGVVVLSAGLYHAVHGRHDRARRRGVATARHPSTPRRYRPEAEGGTPGRGARHAGPDCCERVMPQVAGATGAAACDDQQVMMTEIDALNVLLVEDDAGDVLMVQEVFEDHGLGGHLDVVNDGAEALSFLRQEGAYADARRPHVILLDLNLPRLGGREVLEVVKADPDLATIPVVVLTTSGAEEDVLRAYAAHANAYVTKPVDWDAFTAAIRRIGHFFGDVVRLPGR